MNLEILDKSYDIRWIYPNDLDEEFYFKLWYAFAVLNKEARVFAVGCDSRLSSELLKKSLISWIIWAWKNVIDIWLCSTDMIYFASMWYWVDIAMMITASHNPKEYNWLKSCYKNAVPINMKEFWKEIKDYFLSSSFKLSESSWRYEKRDISDDFVEHIASFIDISKLKKFKIVADAGNWVAWIFMEKLASKLNFELIPMHFEPDGNFPNHHPSPIEMENVVDMIAKVKEIWADLWVAFDWDADRMYICDENWEIWSWSITTAMISKMMLSKSPWKKIIYNAVSSDIVKKTIEDNYWIPIREKVWHVYIKERMAKDEDIIFGGEHSGHYYFRKNANADSWVIAFAVVLALISSSSKKPSELRKEFEVFYSIEETNSKVSDVKSKINELKEIYSAWEIDELDWLTIRFSDYWFNVRPSSNEPLLRLNLEAVSKEIMEEKSKEILDFIRW